MCVISVKKITTTKTSHRNKKELWNNGISLRLDRRRDDWLHAVVFIPSIYFFYIHRLKRHKMIHKLCPLGIDKHLTSWKSVSTGCWMAILIIMELYAKKKFYIYIFRTNTCEIIYFQILSSKLFMNIKKISIFIFDWFSGKLFVIRFTISFNVQTSRWGSLVSACEIL